MGSVQAGWVLGGGLWGVGRSGGLGSGKFWWGVVGVQADWVLVGSCEFL